MLPTFVLFGAVAFFGGASPSQGQEGASGTQDMSTFFSGFKSCSACVGAGYGWCPYRRRCGGFANKECGIGEAYVAEGTSTAVPPQKRAKKDKRGTRPSGAGDGKVPSSGGKDMSAEFARYRDCSTCVNAGYGWCTIQRKCGGFANKECGIGSRYVSADPAPRNGLWESKASKAKRENRRDPKKSERAEARDKRSSGADMSAVFAKLRDCGSCIAAGYGWCTIQRKCGGFANQECGIGPRYYAAEPAAKEERELPPTAVVEPAAPPPPASLLSAGPVKTVEVRAATGEAALADGTERTNATHDDKPLEYDELLRLPHEALAKRVLQLQATLASRPVA